MSKTRWTEELELKLLKRYRKFSCLWTTSFPGYKDLDKRYEAYVKIVESLRPEFPSLTVPKVVYKIRDLRYRYCLELTKIERAACSATSCGRNFTTNFHLFELMHSFPDLNFNRHHHHHHHHHRHDEEENEEYIEPDDDEESKIEDNNTGTYLTPSTCETIYDNRLKMLEDSKSSFEEFEKWYNDSDVDTKEYDELLNVTKSWWKEKDDELRSKEAEKTAIAKTRSKARMYESKKISKGKLHDDIEKLEIKMTRTLLRSSLNDQNRKNYVEIKGENNWSNKVENLDEFEAFGVSIRSQLSNVDPKLIAKVQAMIFMILEEESTDNRRR